MSRQCAIVSLVVGKRHTRLFRRYAEASWRAYANRIGADLVVFDHQIDDSETARRRSVSWQKCLAVQHASVGKYRQVAWLDSDIVIAPSAPSVFDDVPVECVGAVDAYGFPDRERAALALAQCYAGWRAKGVPFIDNATPEEYHTVYGLPHGYDRVVQAGVMVLDPRVHGPIFRYVYERYRDRGGAEWNYEMRPLSYELQRQASVHWLDPRFNAVWGTLRVLDYSHILNPRAHRVWRALDHLACAVNAGRHREARRCVADALAASYFLHFAGGADDMRWSA